MTKLKPSEGPWKADKYDRNAKWISIRDVHGDEIARVYNDDIGKEAEANLKVFSLALDSYETIEGIRAMLDDAESRRPCVIQALITSIRELKGLLEASPLASKCTKALDAAEAACERGEAAMAGKR